MKRRRPLRTDPEKARRWEERSRERQQAEPPKRRPLRTSATGEREDWRKNNPQFRRGRVPGMRGWTQRVFALYGDRCVVCKRRARQGHHAVALRTIFARSEEDGQALGADARNGVPVCLSCHARHENAFRRIRRRELPVGVIEWAYDNDFGWCIDNQLVYP